MLLARIQQDVQGFYKPLLELHPAISIVPVWLISIQQDGSYWGYGRLAIEILSRCIRLSTHMR